MAKTRRTFNRRRRSGPRFDWVYRDDGQNLTLGGLAIITSDDLGTYSPNPSVIPGGQNAGLILYDSKNYLRNATHGGTGFLGMLQGAARAAGKRAQTRMVTGMVMVRTSSWSLGSNLIIGFRIGVFEQDAGNGLLAASAGYNMWNTIGDVTPSVYANQPRSNLWERRIYRSFNDGNTGGTFMVPVMARTRARLADEECLGIFTDVDSDSIDCEVTYWLRTLVSDEA